MRRFLKSTGIVLGGLIAILLLAALVLMWRNRGGLEARLQAIRDAGEPLALAELAGEPIAPEDDAAVYYRRAREDLRAVEREVDAVRQSDNWPNGPLTQEELQTVERAIAAYPNLMPLVRKGASCQRFRLAVDEKTTLAEFRDASTGELQVCRSIARYLSDRCRMLIAEGNRDEAMETCLVNFQLARQLERQPTLVAHLITIAIRTIAIDSANHLLRSGPLSDANREALTGELDRHDLTAAYRRGLISERAVGLAHFGDMKIGRFLPLRGLWNSAVVYYLDVMNQQITLASQPYFAVLEDPPQAIARPRTPWAVLTDLALPAIHTAREATERNRAAMRCLRIVNAVTQVEQLGGDVTDLDGLKLPQQQTIDPFSGRPLRMHKRPDGWVVYSVGKNRQDDGGQLDDQADMGLGPVPQLPAIKPQ